MAAVNRVGVGADRSLMEGYVPSGPKCMEYIQSTAPISLIMGPAASGKTVGSCAKMIWAAQQQLPSPHDNVVRVKGYIIRSTYRDLWDKTIPSYWKCFPKDYKGAKWKGGSGEPATHNLRFRLPIKNLYGDIIQLQEYELIHEFRAVGESTIDDFIAGLEPTWVYLNEVNTLPSNVLSAFYGRCGRYPSPDDRIQVEPGKEPWYGVFGDFDPPSETHWLYDACINKPVEGLKFITQPSGFAPDHENAASLRKIKHNYYEDRAKSMSPYDVKRMIENKWGYDKTGEPVYGEDYNDEIHCSKIEFEPDPMLPVYVGIDGGLTPAAVFGQVDGNGTLCIFDEITTPKGLGWDVEKFAQVFLRHFKTKYPKCKIKKFFPDPALRARLAGASSGLPDDAITWIAQFAYLTGLEFEIPATNDISTRLASVRRRLRLNKGFLLSPRARVTRGGFVASYKFKKDKTGLGAEPEIDKLDPSSHPHDAAQYLSMGVPQAAGAWETGSKVDGVGLYAADDYDLPVYL